MTMLDRMRRHKNWLKWSLALVCLTFVVFYIPSFLRHRTRRSADAATGWRASIRGPSASADFRRRYLAQVNAYRASYGGNLSDAILQQMQVPQQVLQQMIRRTPRSPKPSEMGITVTDAEVRAQIMAIPGLQENGHFIGEERYRALLRAQDPPMTPADFEQNVRQGLMLDKFRAGPHGMDVGLRRRAGARVQAAERKGDARRGRDSRGQLQEPGEPDRRGDRLALRGATRKNTGFPSSGRSSSCASTRPTSRRRSRCRGRRGDVLQRAPRHLHDARADSRQPHPAEDRRQERRGRQSQSRTAC